MGLLNNPWRSTLDFLSSESKSSLKKFHSNDSFSSGLSQEKIKQTCEAKIAKDLFTVSVVAALTAAAVLTHFHGAIISIF